MIKQKRFKKVVKKRDSWSMIIVVILSGILLFTQGILRLNLIYYPSNQISFRIWVSIILSGIIIVAGPMLIIVGINWFFDNIKNRKVYYVEVKEWNRNDLRK